MIENNNKWRKITIGELGKIVTGKTPSTKNDTFWNGDIPFVTPADLQKTKHVFSTERTVSQEGLTAVRGQVLPSGAICVSCIGNLGYTAMTTQVSVSNQQINSIIPSDDFDKNFVYYLMKNLWDEFKNLEGQSTTLSILNKTLFSKIEVSVPDLETQQQIAKVLSSLDDKIELNTQINHNLEEQAKAIYATYFPYSVDDALPDDWRKGTLGEIIDLHDSKRIPLSGNERGKMEKIYPYYGAASLMDYVNDYLFDGVFLLLGEDGTVVTDNGLPVLQYVWGKFWVNNHAHILTGKAGFSVESLLLLLKQTPVKSIVTGAVQPKISQTNLKSIQIVVPPEKLLQEFNSVITPVFALIRQNSEESKRLAQLRDALLPKLMSGEIDVSEVQV